MRQIMKWIIQLIKNKIDWAMMIVGVYLVSYALLDFNSSATYGHGVKFSIEPAQAWAYYYTPEAQKKFAIGMALLLCGFLLYKDKRQDNKK